MWYFSWILGAGLAACFAILNGMWYELRAQQRPADAERPPASPREH